MKSRLDRLATLLRQGPLDPSVTVPSWSDDNTTVPEGLSAEVLYRLRFTAFSNIWMQAQIIAGHLAMRNACGHRIGT